MRSLQEQLVYVKGHPTGFDYLRLTLSMSVIIWHSISVCYGVDAETPFWTGPARPFIFFILPSFFALSGFLIAGSLERNNIPTFLTFRAMRIFPALTVEVLISALIIGPLVTVVALTSYFSSPDFYRYFLNILGHITFYLPGVFEDLPVSGVVNKQLWTVPVELHCYIVITILALLGVARRPFRLFAVTLVTMALFAMLSFAGVKKPAFDGAAPSYLLILSFLCGAVVYLMRQRVAFSWTLFFASTAAYAALVMSADTLYLSTFPVAYMTVFLGLQNPPKTIFIRGADYSYGIYLYGFPLQQGISYLFPHQRIWYFNALGGVALAFACAYLSWTFIESRVLSERKSVLSLVSSACARISRLLNKPLPQLPGSR